MAFIDATISSKSSFGVVCPAFIKVYYYGLLRIVGFIVIALFQPTSYYSPISFIVYRARVQNILWQYRRGSFFKLLHEIVRLTSTCIRRSIKREILIYFFSETLLKSLYLFTATYPLLFALEKFFRGFRRPLVPSTISQGFRRRRAVTLPPILTRSLSLALAPPQFLDSGTPVSPILTLSDFSGKGQSFSEISLARRICARKFIKRNFWAV